MVLLSTFYIIIRSRKLLRTDVRPTQLATNGPPMPNGRISTPQCSRACLSSTTIRHYEYMLAHTTPRRVGGKTKQILPIPPRSFIVLQQPVLVCQTRQYDTIHAGTYDTEEGGREDDKHSANSTTIAQSPPTTPPSLASQATLCRAQQPFFWPLTASHI